MRHRFFDIISIFSVMFLMMAQSFAASDQKPSDIPLKAFAQLKSTSNMQLSPDGRHMAYFTPYEGREVIIVERVGEWKPVAMPAAEDAEILWFRWVNNNRLVLSYAFTAKRETLTTRERRLYGVDSDGKNFKKLIKPKRVKSGMKRGGVYKMPAQIQDNVIDWLPDDPDYILVSLDGDHNGWDEVRRVNVNTGKFKEIFSGHRYIQDYSTDQQHKVRLGWGYNQSTFYKIYRSPRSKIWKNIEKTSWGDEGYNLLAFTEDPKIAYASGTNEFGRRAVYRINLETDEILGPVFSHQTVDYDYIITHPVTNKPVGVQYTVDKPKIAYFDKNLQNIQRNIDHVLPDTVNRIISIQPEKKLYLISAASDVEPGVYYMLDMVIKKLNFISETMPGITPEDMSPVQAVNYKARDGVDIPAYLTIPKGKEAKNLPTVVLVHGGPHARDDQMFDYTVQFLASRGYAVLQPNFRGSEGFGDGFENAGRHQWGGAMQDDVTDGTRWLIEQGIADPERICIAGSSYGGYAAAMGLIKTPDLFKCGISVSAVLNLPALIGFDRKFIGGRSWTKTMGLEGEDPENVSPYHRADEIKPPFLIIHAKDDHRVRYRQAERMAKKLRKLKKDVTFVTMEDGDHNLDTEASRTT